MTERQEMKVRRNAYKFYDEVIYNRQDLGKRDISLLSFQAGADYALKNKYDELKEYPKKKNDKPNIVQFLKDNGVNEAFWDNFYNQNTLEQTRYYLKHHLCTTIAISEAFSWSRTQEGIDFWCELSKKWSDQF
jgi:hypothetical protein